MHYQKLRWHSNDNHKLLFREQAEAILILTIIFTSLCSSKGAHITMPITKIKVGRNITGIASERQNPLLKIYVYTSLLRLRDEWQEYSYSQ